MKDPMVERLTGDQALKRLIAGNKRYVLSRPVHPRQTPERRTELRNGQYPFAVVLGCSDSRVPPEVIFDQGLGDLFVVRVAGNLIDDIILASIEYAAAHLHTPLIMVLGHSECGAVGSVAKGGDLEGHMPTLVEAISPALKKAEGKPGDLVNNAAKVNAKMVSEQLKDTAPILSKQVIKARLKIVAAYYDLKTGVVEIL
jgi:carbonic anhydrase